MTVRVAFTLLTPRIWLMAGALLMLAAVGIRYYQDQLDATRALAMKFGLPTIIEIESFEPARHSNEMHEVQLIARARLSELRMIEGGTKAPLFALPLYAGSGPMDAPLAEYVARRESGVEGLAAFGLVKLGADAGVSRVQVTGTRLLGQAAVSGTAFDGVAALPDLAEAPSLIAADLIERAVVLKRRDLAPTVNMLLVLSFGLFVTAGLSALHGRREITIGGGRAAPASAPVSQRGSRAFQPLASQDELRRSDEAERARQRRSRLSFASALSVDSARVLRNPR